MSRTIRLATYNVHRAIGLDRRKDLGRIAAVLEEIGADVIALQEAEAVTRGGATACQIEDLAARLGMRPVHGPTIVTHDGRYGNGLLSRHEVGEVRRLDLSHRRREPRGALVASLLGDAAGLLVACTHLGLRSAERASQLDALLRSLDDPPEHDVLVILGDLNEWLPVSRTIGRLVRRCGAAPRPATYPALHPLLSLDRAFASPRAALLDVRAHRSRLARVASDHLPLVALVELPEARGVVGDR